MFTGTYEFSRTTQRMVLMVHQTTAIRRSPCPYIYLSKEMYAEMGGVIPKDGELPSPVDSIRITIERSDAK